MNNILAIFRKEMRSYLITPASYIVLFVFLVLTGYFFQVSLFLINQATLDEIFRYIPMIYIFFVPAITMSLISKEKDNGTIETLTTFPISDTEIVIGKFLSSLVLIVIGLLFTLIHFFTIVMLGENVDMGGIFCAYLGLILMGGAYSAIGVFTSTLSNNQIIAFIISFFIVFFLFIVQSLLFFLPAGMASFFQNISSVYHFQNMGRGIIDSRNIIYFISIIAIFLKLAVTILESRKWR